MNEELRRALDLAAGQEPQVDLTETVWSRGRVVRRRRHAAQAVGGAAAAAVLAGAFFLGGGLLEPQADVGPAGPTLQENADATVPVPTTEETQEPAPSTEPAQPPSSPGLTLTTTSIDGVPLDGPTADLVAVVSAELGEPFATQVDIVGGCSGEEVFSLYNWEGFLLFVRGADGPDAHRSWETQLSGVTLPQGVQIGMTLEEVRALDSVTELVSVASPHYQLGSGIVVSTTDGVVVTAQSERAEVC
jgi:hypothetical protein